MRLHWRRATLSTRFTILLVSLPVGNLVVATRVGYEDVLGTDETYLTRPRAVKDRLRNRVRRTTENVPQRYVPCIRCIWIGHSANSTA